MRSEILKALKENRIQAICGYPGIGKSYLSSKKIGFEDCFYSRCRYFNRAVSSLERPEYPDNWIARVNNTISNNNIVLVACNPDARQIFDELGIKYLLVYPPKSDKSRYFHIYDTRSDEREFISLNKDRYDSYIELLQSTVVPEGCFKEELLPGQTLMDYLTPYLNTKLCSIR